MVGLQMIDDDIIYTGNIRQFVDLSEIFVSLEGFYQVDDGFFLIVNKERVIGNTFLGNGP